MEAGIDLALVAVFFAAAAGMQAAKMLRIPSVISLILVGLFFGPAFLNIVQPSLVTGFLAGMLGVYFISTIPEPRMSPVEKRKFHRQLQAPGGH